jgi:chromosomal replication initiation ATPase DnaA
VSLKSCTRCGDVVRKDNTTGFCGPCRNSQFDHLAPTWAALRETCTVEQIANRYGVAKATICRYTLGTGIRGRRMAEEKSQAIVEDIALRAWRIFDLPPGQIWTRKRGRATVYARGAVYTVAKERGVSYAAIGRVFEYDHTTVIHSCRVAENIASRDPEFAGKIEALRAAVSSPERIAA